MSSSKIGFYRVCGIIWASMILIVLIVILSLQWRKVEAVDFVSNSFIMDYYTIQPRKRSNLDSYTAQAGTM